MSQDGDPDETAPDAAAAAPAAAARPRGDHVHRSLLAELVVVLALLLGVMVVGRYGPLTDTGKTVVAAYLNGLKLGQLGKLHIEGLTGDVWRDFSVGRMTVSDSRGVWLEARQVELKWQPADLIRRRFHAQALNVGDLHVIRQPILGPSPPPSPSGKQPLSLVVDSARVQLDTEPEFSTRRGQFLITARLDIERRVRAAAAPSPGPSAWRPISPSSSSFMRWEPRTRASFTCGPCPEAKYRRRATVTGTRPADRPRAASP